LGSVDGFWAIFSCLVYRGPPVLLGFGPLVDHWGVEFGPWWTEKIGLYTSFTEIIFLSSTFDASTIRQIGHNK
jgi:hypothetical protein